MISGSVNITYTEGGIASTTAVGYTSLAIGTTSGVIQGSVTAILSPISEQSANTSTSTAASSSTSNSTTAPKPIHTSASKATSNSVSAGEAAGIAIATFVVGVLLAAVFLTMWQKRKSKQHRYPNDGGFRGHSTREIQNEKSGFRNGTAVEIGDFDHDRLFPQPLDDAAIKSQAQNLFSQIDGHVETFYTDATDDFRLQSGTPQALLSPQSRPFMMKRIITQTMIESMSERCAPDRAFLPFNFTDVARRLQDINLNDQGKSLK